MTQRADMPGNRGRSGVPSENRHFRRNFWATTGIATIVAAIIGAVATFVSTRGSDDRPQTPPATTAAQVGDAAPPPATTAAAADAEIFWQGTFVFHTYVDFDSAPPKNGEGKLTQDVKGNLGVYNDGGVWTGASPPTKQQCADQIATRAADHIPLDVGTQVCYRTEGERVVYFKVTALVEEGGLLATPRFELSVVVWRR